jgi:hypothetical protein
MPPRSYLLLVTVSALLAAAVIAGLDWWAARPAVMERTRFVLERKTAASIARGEPVILGSRLNEWMLRWHLAREIPQAPDVAVMGSSHSLGVSAGVMGANRAMNFSISGSSLADYLVTASILDARGIRPARWVVFVDGWLFDLGADYRAWPLQAGELIRMESLLAARAIPPLEKIFSNNQAAPGGRIPAFGLEPVLRTIDGAIEEALLSAQPAGPTTDGQILAADGSLPATADGQRPSPAEVEALALRQFLERPDRHRYGNYPRVDANLWSYFEQWVQRCREQGGEVWLVLSPYHPVIYPRMSQSPGNQLQAVEARVRDFGRRSGVPVLGSYDPARAGLPAGLFYDGDHLLEEGLRQLLAPVRESASRKP